MCQATRTNAPLRTIQVIVRDIIVIVNYNKMSRFPGVFCTTGDAAGSEQVDGEQRDILGDVETSTDHDNVSYDDDDGKYDFNDDALLTKGYSDVQQRRRCDIDVCDYDCVTCVETRCS